MTANITLTEALRSTSAMVERDQRNAHAGYDYASADAIYAHVRDACLAAGVLPHQTEQELEFIERTNSRGKPSTWARITYRVGLQPVGSAPVKMDAWETVTVLVQVTGSQSLGAARTYALKYYLRGKFLLATGDLAEDLDSSAPEPLPQPAPKPTAQEPTAQEPTGQEPFKDYVKVKRQEVKAKRQESQWSDYKRAQLHAQLVTLGEESGMDLDESNRRLADRYGSADPLEWTETQCDEGHSIVKASRAEKE